jgi:DNA-binding transcriptional regulator YiaG
MEAAASRANLAMVLATTPLKLSISQSAISKMQNPERVELVRRRLGLTKIRFAPALGIDRKTLQRFESEDHALNDKSMDALVALSGYPREFFYKGDFDYPNAEAVSFRSLRSLAASVRDAAIAAGALAFELDDWITGRFELAPHSIPRLNNAAPTDAAIFLRSYWSMGERPIRNMINVLESHGVRVFSLAEETRHLDAYSFWRSDRPYIFLNTLKTPEHSRFDAAHELGHLVLHRHGGPSHRNAEDDANSFGLESSFACCKEA